MKWLVKWSILWIEIEYYHEIDVLFYYSTFLRMNDYIGRIVSCSFFSFLGFETSSLEIDTAKVNSTI